MSRAHHDVWNSFVSFASLARGSNRDDARRKLTTTRWLGMDWLDFFFCRKSAGSGR